MCCYQGRTLSWHSHFFTRSGLKCQCLICPCFSLSMGKAMSVWGMARDELVPFGTCPWEWDVTTGRKAQEGVTGRCCFLALTGNREYFDVDLQTVSPEKALGVRRRREMFIFYKPFGWLRVFTPLDRSYPYSAGLRGESSHNRRKAC